MVKEAGPARSKYAVAEFFAGIGLVRLALERHPFRVVFANDIDKDKASIYRDNFGEDDLNVGDIRDLSARQLPSADLFTASFPCNDLSIAGSMNGINSGQSSAFWGLIEIVQAMGDRRPSLILLENVPGFLMSHGGQDLAEALSSLNRLGYAVDVLLIDAQEFVPQSRMRLFVVAKRGVAGSYPFGIAASKTRPEAVVQFMLRHPEIDWDVADLPSPVRERAELSAVLEDLPDDDPAWWDAERAAYFLNQLSERHATVAAKMIAARSYSFGTAFRRVRNGRSMAELRVDGIAGCLRTPRGGSGRQILFKAGKGKYQVRLLTPRECARLQGVPDTFAINASLNKALFGFGDAVCVPVVSWIAKNYLLPHLQGNRDASLAAAATD